MLFYFLFLLACVSVDVLLAKDISAEEDFGKLSEQQIWRQFQVFRQKYNRSYKDAGETFMRLQLFTENLKKVMELNKRAGKRTFGINKFSDYTEEETRQMMPIFKGPSVNDCTSNVLTKAAGDKDPPQQLDWRKLGAVTGVKNQGMCGSCWAFSSTGAVEGAHAIKTKKLISLSEQQLMDCETEDESCNGGLPTNAVSYVVKHGIDSESDYPYEGYDEQCQTNRSVVSLTGCVTHDIQNEDALRGLLASTGPLSICLYAKGAFQDYTNGVLEYCPSDQEIDHAVLLVGYGTDEDGVPYWLIKNSWGTDWGEDGYIRVKRNINACNFTFTPAVQAVA